MLIEMSDTMLGRNMLFLRRKYHISRKGLSCLTGISVYTLKDWEEERVIPVIQWEQLNRISEVFNIPGEDLVHKDLDICRSKRPPCAKGAGKNL